MIDCLCKDSLITATQTKHTVYIVS